MFESFGLNIVHYVIVESICLGSGSLHCGCVNNDFFGWVWGWFNEIKAKHSLTELPQVSRG